MEEKATQTEFKVNTLPAARQQGNEEVEIDLVKLFWAIRERIVLIIILTVIGGGIAAAISLFAIPKQYTSTSKMLVLTKETTLSSLADLQMGSQLTNDYTVLIKSRPVLQKVIDNLGLNMDYRVLNGELSVNNPTQTRILEISIKDQSPEMAMTIVNEVSNVAADYISEKMEVTRPNIIEEGILPTSKTSPSNTKNTMIGALLGLLIGVAIAVINELMNDAIYTEEDVERYLGLTTLASIPDKANTETKRRKKKKKKAAEAKKE